MAGKSINISINSKDNTAKGLHGALGNIKNFVKSVTVNLTNIQSGFQMAGSFFAKIGETIKTAFRFERAEAEFKTLTGSVDMAKAHIDDLRKMAAATPLTFEDLARASKLLQAFGTSADEVLPYMKTLGDIALGDAQRFQGLALVFAQVKSQGRLMGQDLLQFINQGFNPLKEISDATGRSMSELKEAMRDGQISFDMVAKAMERATVEGGKFHNAMENSSKTGEGLISTLKDNWTLAVAKFGESFMDSAKGGIQFMIDKLKELEKSGAIERWGERTNTVLSGLAKAGSWTMGVLDKAMIGLESGFSGVGAFVGTLAGGGSFKDAKNAHNAQVVDTFSQLTKYGKYADSDSKTEGDKDSAAKEKAKADEKARKEKEKADEKARKEKAKADEKARKEKAKADEKARKEALKFAREDARAKIDAARKEKKEKEKQIQEELDATIKALNDRTDAAQKKLDDANNRIVKAQDDVAQANGWILNPKAMGEQRDAEKQAAKDEKFTNTRYEKDLEQLQKRDDWRTATNLSNAQEAARRRFLAEEEKAAAEQAAADAAADLQQARDDEKAARERAEEQREKEIEKLEAIEKRLKELGL